MKNAVILLFLCLCLSQVGEASTSIRKPVVAGSFYPSNPSKLSAQLDSYFAAAKGEPFDEVYAFILPHAGYIYSGGIAAEGYARAPKQQYDAIVVLAPSHHESFKGVSICNVASYQTPLGNVPLHTKIVDMMKSMSPLITSVESAHKSEHSLEVQLPFLQKKYGEFNLVPIVFGDQNIETAEVVARALFAVSQKYNMLVIASTDLSHYEQYGTACAFDKETINAIMSDDVAGVATYFMQHPDAACGKMPVLVALRYSEMRGAVEKYLIDYKNSGDTAGSKDNVVGYAAIALIPAKEDIDMSDNGGALISRASKRELFSLVRKRILEFASTGKISLEKVTNSELDAELGMFVTLHTKQGALRGCIGCFVSDDPLWKTVQTMAISSAFKDPRFAPVRENELSDLTVEISLLSPMKKIDSIDQIQLGVHGIYIKKGRKGGTFLPQVATDTGWNLEEFLGHCAQDKAGIGWDGWKEAEIFTYTAEVFSEDSLQ